MLKLSLKPVKEGPEKIGSTQKVVPPNPMIIRIKINRSKPGGDDKVSKVIKSKSNNAATFRENVRKQLEDSFSRVASEVVDDEKVRQQVMGCDPIQVAAAVEDAMFRKIGWSTGIKKAKYQSLLFNLKEPNNPDLRREVLVGKINPEMLVNLSSEEMASKKRQHEIVQIQLKYMNKRVHSTDQIEKATTDMFLCGRCHERKCTYHQLQTRSADEPMTTYVTCLNCNNHWKFS